MLEELLTLNLFGFFLIFARLGSALSIMPGFSASFVSMRLRLGIALAISFVMAPVLIGNLPVRPPSVIEMAILIAGEILIGVFFGTIARILMGALQTAGTVIAYVSSMANAMIQDPIAEQQSSTVAGFLLIVGTLLIFATTRNMNGLGWPELVLPWASAILLRESLVILCLLTFRNHRHRLRLAPRLARWNRRKPLPRSTPRCPEPWLR